MTEIFEDIIKNIDGLVKKVSKKSEKYVEKVLSNNGFKFMLIKEDRYQDINTLKDWKLAEKKFRLFSQKGR